MTYKFEARRVPVLWALVADRSAARIFAADWPDLGQFRELESLIHPQGSLHGRDMHPDRFGQSHAPDGHGFTDQPQTDIRHFTAGVFAVQVVKRLEKGRNNDEFGRLVMIAPPLMLGELRGRLTVPLQKQVELELPKELVQASTNDIREQVRKALEKARVEP